MKILEIYFEELFSKIPITKLNKEAKEKIINIVENVYQEKLISGIDNNEIISHIILEYGSYKNIENILQIKLDKEIDKRSHKTIKKNLFIANIYSYVLGGASLLFSTILFNLIDFQNNINQFLVLLILITIFIFIYRQFTKLINFNKVYNAESLNFLSSKKNHAKLYFANSIGLGCLFFIMSFIPLMLSLFKNNAFINNIELDFRFAFCIIIFLIIKTYFKYSYLHQIIDFEKVEFKKETSKIFSISLIYFSFVFLISYIIRANGKTNLMIIYFLFSGVLYIVGFILYHIHYLKKNGYQLFTKRQKIFINVVLIILVFFTFLSNGSWYLQPYINTVSNIETRKLDINFDQLTGIYEIKNNQNDFKILQLTDIHLGGSLFTVGRDLKALRAVYDLIDYSKPDFVIITGDFTFSLGIQSLNLNNYIPLMQFTSFMRNIGVPWAFTYGNHDSETLSTHNADALNSMFSEFSYQNKKLNLLYTSIQPVIYGRNNQIIKVLNKDDSINQVLFLIDSNAYVENSIFKYDYIRDNQVDWYEMELKKIIKDEGNKDLSSIVFFHIPLQEYQVAYDLYKQKSEEVIYHYGEIKEKNESISCSAIPSKLFDTMVKLGSTKAVFVGHDHYNDLSITYKGIRLTYGKSIDFLAYPGIIKSTFQRGGTLITINQDSSFEVESILLENIKNLKK